jgi:hypothetical protein
MERRGEKDDIDFMRHRELNPRREDVLCLLVSRPTEFGDCLSSHPSLIFMLPRLFTVINSPMLSLLSSK